MEKDNTYIGNEPPSTLICTGALISQKFACFLCDVSIFPSTALFRCVIPRTDRYWARVYGETGADIAFRRAQKWRGFCKKCAPDDALPKKCAPSTMEMKSRGCGNLPIELTNWLIKNRFSYKNNWEKKSVSAYGHFLSETAKQPAIPSVSFDVFNEEMNRLYSHNKK